MQTQVNMYLGNDMVAQNATIEINDITEPGKLPDPRGDFTAPPGTAFCVNEKYQFIFSPEAVKRLGLSRRHCWFVITKVHDRQVSFVPTPCPDIPGLNTVSDGARQLFEQMQSLKAYTVKVNDRGFTPTVEVPEPNSIPVGLLKPGYVRELQRAELLDKDGQIPQHYRR